MCKGSDIIKVAGIAAAVYTGGAAAGLWGAAEGAAGAGAIAGSEAAANAVGAAGGDAIGSLIASNATNWGVNVAPEIAALGMGAGAGAAVAGSEAGGAYGTGGAAAGGTAAAGAPAAGASTWLQTAKTVAPFVSAAGSALTGIAALSGAARGVPNVQAAQLPQAPTPGQSGLSPDLYAALKRKNALLFAGSGAESTDLTRGKATNVTLGSASLLGA